MKIVFMGTPEFASVTLNRLYGDGYDVTGVFTQPDRRRNRGMKTSFSPVKEAALARGTPVFQPESLKNGVADGILRNLEFDLIAVVAYGQLVPATVLRMPRLGCINLHGSLLPKYRGAAPIQWAILNGETETGVTSMLMAEEIDTGDILLTSRVAIGEDETAGELSVRLSVLGARIFSETIGAISRSEAVRIPQNDSEASHAPSLRKEMSPIDWNQSAASIRNKVRGLNPWPVATTELCGTVCRVFSVGISGNIKTGKKPGMIVSTGLSGIEIACADGSVLIKELQAPGGKRMTAGDYLRGRPSVFRNTLTAFS